MAVITLASATGSPGVTTTALGLTLAWHRESLLVDADRQPSQAVLAGYLSGADAVGIGLSDLARSHRERRALAPELLGNTVPLRPGEPRRYFLPGFSHPGSPALFSAVWDELGRALRQAHDAGIDVFVDAGRIGEGLPGPLVTHSDALLVVTRSSLRALAAIRLHLPALRQRVQQLRGVDDVGLLIVGENRPYSRKEIAAQFEIPVWGCVAWDPASADVYSEGTLAGRRFAASSFVKSLQVTASALRGQLPAPAPRAGWGVDAHPGTE